MKQEYILVVIVGLLLAAYVLEAVVQPLDVVLKTPYHFIQADTLRTYPFTTTIIIVRALALFLAPLWVMSFIPKKFPMKGAIALLLAGLTQLYVLQELATGSKLLHLEWSLAISLAGLAMLVPMIMYFFRGMFQGAYDKLADEGEDYEPEEEDSSEQEVEVDEEE